MYEKLVCKAPNFDLNLIWNHAILNENEFFASVYYRRYLLSYSSLGYFMTLSNKENSFVILQPVGPMLWNVFVRNVRIFIIT